MEDYGERFANVDSNAWTLLLRNDPAATTCQYWGDASVCGSVFDLSHDILLRQPLLSWAVREDIPFIRAVRHIPQVMKKRLPAQYLKALDTMACTS